MNVHLNAGRCTVQYNTIANDTYRTHKQFSIFAEMQKEKL